MDSLSLRFGVCTALCAFALGGCAKETGILVVVDRDDTVPPEIDHLDFSIGIATDIPDRFDLDDASSIEVPMQGRDVKVSPYELLIHPDDVETAIVVAVLAYDAQGQVVG